MERDRWITDSISSLYPRIEEDQRFEKTKKEILNSTAIPIQLVHHNAMLQEQGFRDGDIRKGVSELLATGKLKMNQDRTIRKTTDYQLEFDLNTTHISPED